MYFEDADVEEHFGISVSKLRTAQRYQLIEAAVLSRSRHYRRGWSTFDVLKVCLAQTISLNLAIAFHVAVQLLAHTRSQTWKTLWSAFRCPDGDHDVPTIELVNRRFIITNFAKESWCVGTIEPGDTGRSDFKFDRHRFDGDLERLAAPDRVIARSFIDLRGPLLAFRETYLKTGREIPARP